MVFLLSVVVARWMFRLLPGLVGLFFVGGLFPADNMWSTRVDALAQVGDRVLWRRVLLAWCGERLAETPPPS